MNRILSTHRNLRSLILGVTTLVLQGCFSSSVLQTARPLERGEHEITVSAAGYSYMDLGGLAPEISYRTGIARNCDVGFSYSVGLWGHLKADLKYSLWRSKNQGMFLSSGVGLDLVMDGDNYLNPDFALTLPLYYSFNHNGMVVPYFAQRFTMGIRDIGIIKYWGSPEQQGVITKEHHLYYHGGAGVRIGRRRAKFFAEYSYSHITSRWYNNHRNSNQVWVHIKELSEDFNHQVSIGVLWTIDRR